MSNSLWTEMRELALVVALVFLANGASVGVAALIAMSININ